MQVLKRRNNKRITLSLFQSSWHNIVYSEWKCCGGCVVFLPWTFILESPQNNELLLLEYLFLQPALNKVVRTLLSSGISRALCITENVTRTGVSKACTLSCFSQRGNGFGLSIHILMPGSLKTNSRKWASGPYGWSTWLVGFGPELWCC